MEITWLTVHVAGSKLDDRLLAVPFDVMSRDGDRVAQGVASPSKPASLRLPGDSASLERVYVVARLATGELIQQVVPLDVGDNDVTLSTVSGSPDDWLAWVTPFTSLPDFGGMVGEQNRSGVARQRIGRVWMTLWRLKEKEWVAIDVTPLVAREGRGRRQITLELPLQPHLLQVGGDAVSWRFISLPPGDEVRVALTATREGQEDAVEVTVSRVRAQNELVLAYLAEGAIGAADRLTEIWHAADIALYRKLNDPVSAAAGAYLLLKFNRLEEHAGWVRNLVNWFPWLSDGPIVAAALALRRNDANELEARKYLRLASERGLPLFSFGASLLVETMAAVHKGRSEAVWFKQAYQRARSYLLSRAGGDIYFTFHGGSPLDPSPTAITGMQSRSMFAERRSSDVLTDMRTGGVREVRGDSPRRRRLRSSGTVGRERYKVTASLVTLNPVDRAGGFTLADRRSREAYMVFDDED